ncbi:MAG TPA: PAS domain-containing protein, partial [Candidatus Wallbacteria bacterium]|nr:PAS domain-containing protein [Candidatus Wallbacteria bacterium]
TDRIIETSPNGIIILDEKLHIISMNGAFKKMFMCSEVVIGKRISYIIDPANFEKLSTRGGAKIETIEKYPSYNLICHEILYALSDEKQYVGIFVDITNLEINQKRLDEIKSKTVCQASELLEHQINMAQQMAKFLGEYTARGEELVKNLMKVSEPDNPPADRNIYKK